MWERKKKNKAQRRKKKEENKRTGYKLESPRDGFTRLVMERLGGTLTGLLLTDGAALVNLW